MKVFFSILMITMMLLGSVAADTALAAKASQETDVAEEPLEVIVNINTANAEELLKVSGIGPKLAERILTYRAEVGPFQNIEELMNVNGIGEMKFEKIRTLITV